MRRIAAALLLLAWPAQADLVPQAGFKVPLTESWDMDATCHGGDMVYDWTITGGSPMPSWHVAPWRDKRITIVGYELLRTLIDGFPIANNPHDFFMVGNNLTPDPMLWLAANELHRREIYPYGYGHPFPAKFEALPSNYIDLHGRCFGGGRVRMKLTLHYIVNDDQPTPPEPQPNPCAVATTLNPADKSAHIVLSGGNRTASGDGTNDHAMVRSVAGMAPNTGIYQIEAMLTGVGAGGTPIVLFGLQDPATAVNTHVAGGGTGFALGYNPGAGNSLIYSINFTGSGAAPAFANAIYAIRYNSDTGVTQLVRDNAVVATRARLGAATLHAAVSIFGQNGGAVAWNFGQAPFTNTLPEGGKGLCSS